MPSSIKSSFPNIVGVRYLPLFQAVIPESRSRESVVNVVALFHNNRSPTETFGDDAQIAELSSFPSVVVGNPSFLLSLLYFITTDPRQKPSGMTPKADLSSFPNVAGVRYLPLFQVVIPESRSRESAVSVVVALFVKTDPRQKPSGMTTQVKQPSFPKVVVGNPSLLLSLLYS